MNPELIACFFSTSGHSGIDRAADNLIPALASRGYRVDLLKVRKHGPTLAQKPAGVRIIDLGSSHTLACLPAIVRYLRENRPVVMFSDKDKVNRTALAARWLSHVPTRLVLSIGTTVSINLHSRGALTRWGQRLSIGWLYRLAHQVLVPSRGVADDMASFTRLPRDRILVVPRPVVPAELFQEALPEPDHPWFLRKEVPVILSVGELSWRKDFEMLLRAFARVRTTRHCRLIILGRGKQRARLLALAEELGVAEDVELPGFIPNPYAYMAHADLFAFTSRWEGLGFVLIEALATGTPVVSTDCPSGPREILRNGEYGPLVPVGDDRRMAEAILTTLASPLPACKLREAALPYEIENSVDAHLLAMGLPARAALTAGGP